MLEHKYVLNTSWDILIMKKNLCLSEIQIELDVLYFYLLNLIALL